MNTAVIWLLLKPSHVLLYTAVLGVLLWPTKLGRWCRGAAAVLLILLGVLPMAAYMLRPLESRFGTPAELERVDGIIVLAGPEMPTLSAAYAEPQLSEQGDRLTTFLILANRFPEARLVHSGNGMGQGAGQSDVARRIILGAGIAPERIVFEDRSRNTCEGALLTRELVQPGEGERWLLVTSSFHMPRSVACFRAVDWEITPYPTDFQRGAIPWSFGLVGNLEDFDLAAHEWLGLVYYRLRGYTNELFPKP